MKQQKRKYIWWIRKPFFYFLTIFVILGFIFQIILPELFFESQENLRQWLLQFEPFDKVIFIMIQALQVIIAPISHYAVGLAGGFLYGSILGGIYNYIGRIIGHVSSYWIGYYLQNFVKKIFNPNDFEKYQKFIKGDKKTLWIRLLILFLMIFLPLFPDDEISYLVGLAGLKFKYYFLVLLLGHIGGSFALSYLGAGEAKDPVFFGFVLFGIICTLLLIFLIKRNYKKL